MDINLINCVVGDAYAAMNLIGGNRQAKPIYRPPARMNNSLNGGLAATGFHDDSLDMVESYGKTKSGILIPNMKEHSFITIPKAEILRPELSSGLVLA